MVKLGSEKDRHWSKITQGLVADLELEFRTPAAEFSMPTITP